MDVRELLKRLYLGHVNNYVIVEDMAKQNNVDVGTMQVLLILGGQLCEEDEENGTD